MTEPQPLVAATTKDHPRAIYPEVRALWTGPAASRVGVNNPDAATTRWEWDVKLSPADATAFDRVVDAARRGLTPTEYAAIEADLALARDYLNIQAPTTAQTAAVVKAIIRSIEERFRID